MRWRSALVLLQALERQAAVAPRGAGGHGHRDEGRLGDLGVRGAGNRGLLRVSVDAPGTLRDLGDAEGDELLGLRRNRAVLERLLIELEEGLVGLRRSEEHTSELQ